MDMENTAPDMAKKRLYKPIPLVLIFIGGGDRNRTDE